jgi:hypothetical protein
LKWAETISGLTERVKLASPTGPIQVRLEFEQQAARIHRAVSASCGRVSAIPAVNWECLG